MPLYEYKRHKCLQTFEVRQKFSDEPLTVHEECGGEAERLISIPSLQFKGSGFYITDYGKGGKSPASNGSNGKSETKSESKSDSSSSSSDSSSSKSESSAPKSETTTKSESKPDSKPSAS